jgi:hypothetical protein
MGELLWEKPGDICLMRCKGTFIAHNSSNMLAEYMLQGVDEVFEFKELSV